MKLLHGDCLDIMPTIESGSVDMVMCDLPYGTTACKWDTIIPFAPLWEQYKRIIKPRGAIVLTASQPFTSALVMSNLKWFRHEWIWEKQKGTNFPQSGFRPLNAHEHILVFARGKTTYNPQKTDLHRREIRSPGCNVSSRGTAMVNPGSSCESSKGHRVYVGRFPRSVQKFSNESMKRGSLHPTQKPVALMEYMIRTYTNAGETVLDNCFGSGTTGVACVNTGREFIGIEKDAEYFEVARKRIESTSPLFSEVA